MKLPTLLHKLNSCLIQNESSLSIETKQKSQFCCSPKIQLLFHESHIYSTHTAGHMGCIAESFNTKFTSVLRRRQQVVLVKVCVHQTKILRFYETKKPTTKQNTPTRGKQRSRQEKNESLHPIQNVSSPTQ